MYAFGRARSERMMARNEEDGRANSNPYAQAVYRRFVLPLAEIIREDVSNKKPGRRKAHTVLLGPMDPEAVAFLAVRNTLNALLHGSVSTMPGREITQAAARSVMTVVGRAVYHELLLSLFAEASPDLFYTLTYDLGRRMSKSERHRMTVFKMQAKEHGVPVPEWGAGGVQQIGAYLLDQLEALGMLEMHRNTVVAARASQVRNTVEVRLSPALLDLINEVKGHIMETTPYYLPCVEPPKDWTAVDNGGFHTKEMRRLHPFAVRSHGGWSEFEEHDMSTPLAAINALQAVPWKINGDMLDTIRLVAKHFDMEEVLSQAECPSPDKPDWLIGDMKIADMSPGQAEEFVHWKRQKAEWFTQMKLRGTKYGRFYTATTVADKFRQFPAIYFVYFADFRGRLYAQTTGVSPQGSDMQKALLHFATGKPLDTVEAERWFCIHGANKWGYDKASLDDRVKWADDHHQQLMSFADDPVANSGWTEADSPLQFLAWVLEYAAWRKSPHDFISRIPVGMDGSCNGLQNFSAMLRDEVGGKATNLVPALLPNDIYQMVADVTAHKLRQVAPVEAPAPDGTEETDKAILRINNENSYRLKWLKHGINRTLVKRSVMTLPYGSTRFSCADFIVDDYLKFGKAPEFEKIEYGNAARYLSHFVWDAIADVVVKAREAMVWLQDASRKIMKDGTGCIRWVTPSGFPVAQYYQEQEVHRINTKLCGNAKIRVNTDTATPDKPRHRNGIAPNFIHSMDASHLALVTVAAAAMGMMLAMIHDDYGTHAADAGKLYRVIREVFVAMYENNDPLSDFATKYDLSNPPDRGHLDLRAVLQSQYFFS
jgi:Mitochondrial DNA-directed RNA polymerase